MPCKMGRHIILLDGSDVEESGSSLYSERKHDQAAACEGKRKSNFENLIENKLVSFKDKLIGRLCFYYR